MGTLSHAAARRARSATLAAFGVALGFTIGRTGLADWGELHRMFTMGVFDGGPSARDLRLVIAFAGAVALAGLGFLALARRDAIPRRPVGRTTVPGALLFGAGWAVTGGCPAAVLVQLGEGRLAALASLAGALGGAWACRWANRRLGLETASCSGPRSARH